MGRSSSGLLCKTREIHIYTVHVAITIPILNIWEYIYIYHFYRGCFLTVVSTCVQFFFFFFFQIIVILLKMLIL